MKKQILLSILMLFASIMYSQTRISQVVGDKKTDPNLKQELTSIKQTTTSLGQGLATTNQEVAGKFSISDGVPANTLYYTETEVNLIRDNLKHQERQQQYLRLGADTLFFPIISSGNFGSSGTVLIDNTAYVLAYEIEVPTRIQNVKWVASATGNALWEGFNGFVLLNSSGTKIDETANTPWTQTAFQLASLDFTTKAELQPGVYYLWQGSNWSGTPTVQPAVYTLSGTNAITNRFISASHKFAGTITGQTNIPTSISISSLTEVSTIPGFVLCK